MISTTILVGLCKFKNSNKLQRNSASDPRFDELWLWPHKFQEPTLLLLRAALACQHVVEQTAVQMHLYSNYSNSCGAYAQHVCPVSKLRRKCIVSLCSMRLIHCQSGN